MDFNNQRALFNWPNNYKQSPSPTSCINSFHVTGHFLYSQEVPETQRLSHVFGRCGETSEAWNDTAWKVSVFEVFLVLFFTHSDWIERDPPYLSVSSPHAGKYGPEKLGIRTLFKQCGLRQFVPIFLSISMLPSVLGELGSTGKKRFKQIHIATSWHNTYRRTTIGLSIHNNNHKKK